MRPPAAARMPVSAVLAFALIPVVFHLVIVATSHVHFALRPSFGEFFKLGFVTAAALTHWGIYSSLLLTFGLTLRPGHEALITAMARRLQGSLPADQTRYTRQVTIAWCGFFAAQLVVSITLFCFAPLVIWSSFVNILDIPLVVSMFCAEYLCRQRCLRDPPRHSLAMIMNMISDAKSPAAPWPRPGASGPADAVRPD
jgi:uncharacterized membrane protein